jgi:hypothetical protein
MYKDNLRFYIILIHVHVLYIWVNAVTMHEYYNTTILKTTNKITG